MKIPAFLFPLLNPIVTLLLNSPLHGLMSGSVLVLYYTGRRSGQARSTPVRYFEEGGQIVLITEKSSGWWPNFLDGAAAAVQLRGQRVAVQAVAFKPPATQVAEHVDRMLDTHPADAVYMGINKRPTAEQTADESIWDPASLADAYQRLVAVELTRSDRS